MIGNLPTAPFARWKRIAVVGTIVTALCPGGIRGASAKAAPGAISWKPYRGVLTAVVNDRGHVDYARLTRHRERLDTVVARIAAVDPATLTALDRRDQMAFWINTYNALTLRLIVDHYPLTSLPRRDSASPHNSIRQIQGAWDGIVFTVAGEKMTLDHIENDVLRAKFVQPAMHMALVCAARSCPPLRAEPYDGAHLAEQLADQARRFLSDPTRFAADRDAGVARISPIFNWFAGDFSAAARSESGNAHVDQRLRAALAFVADHVDESHARWLRTGAYRVEFLPYDWTLNDAEYDRKSARKGVGGKNGRE